MSDTGGRIKKTYCNKKKTAEIKNKMPSVTGLVTTTVMNTKATEIQNKIPDITNMTTKMYSEYKSSESWK